MGIAELADIAGYAGSGVACMDAPTMRRSWL
jgi:hypothetical protein